MLAAALRAPGWGGRQPGSVDEKEWSMTRAAEKTLWHALDSDGTVGVLETNATTGLSSAEAAERLRTYGPKAPEDPPQETVGMP